MMFFTYILLNNKKMTQKIKKIFKEIINEIFKKIYLPFIQKRHLKSSNFREVWLNLLRRMTSIIKKIVIINFFFHNYLQKY